MTSPTNIGGDENTPDQAGQVHPRGPWATMTTGEIRLAQTVAGRECKSNWWRVIGVAGAAVALVQFLNSAGPCDNGWKFQTKEAAAQSEAANAQEHMSIRKEIRDALGAVLTAIQNQKKGK